jgi:DnaJ-class molecular chaperone
MLSLSIRNFSISSSLKVLGLSRNPTEEQIRAAYKTMAMRYHPDSTKLEDKEAAKRLFQESVEARDELLDSLNDVHEETPAQSYYHKKRPKSTHTYHYNHQQYYDDIFGKKQYQYYSSEQTGEHARTQSR